MSGAIWTTDKMGRDLPPVTEPPRWDVAELCDLLDADGVAYDVEAWHEEPRADAEVGWTVRSVGDGFPDWFAMTEKNGLMYFDGKRREYHGASPEFVALAVEICERERAGWLAGRCEECS